MKIKYLLLVLSSLFAGSLSIQSQTYNFSAMNVPYQNLAGGTPLVNTPWDDPYLQIPIGFGFRFYGDTLYNLHTFFSGIVFTDDLADDITPFILLFSPDLIDRGYDVAQLLSPITYSTTGSPGNRVFTVEWKNAGFYNEFEVFGTFTDFVNIQLKIFEANGDFAFHYGPNSVVHPDLCYDNNPGPTIGAVESLDITLSVSFGETDLLIGNPADPEVINTVQVTFLDGTIPANTLYQFSRPPTAVNETVNQEAGQYYFPNPCTHSVTLKPESRQEIKSLVSVINSYGALVRTDYEPDIIELDGLPPGVYELRFQTGKNQYAQRILVLQER